MTKQPVTLGGWYENEDGSWSEIAWRSGQTVLRTVSVEELSILRQRETDAVYGAGHHARLEREWAEALS